MDLLGTVDVSDDCWVLCLLWLIITILF